MRKKAVAGQPSSAFSNRGKKEGKERGFSREKGSRGNQIRIESLTGEGASRRPSLKAEFGKEEWWGKKAPKEHAGGSKKKNGSRIIRTPGETKCAKGGVIRGSRISKGGEGSVGTRGKDLGKLYYVGVEGEMKANATF